MNCQRDGKQLDARSFHSLILRTLPLCLVLVTTTLAFANPVKAATINVPSGGDLQAAINNAQSGDVIILQAGASYVGSFVLPAKSGDSYITIQSSALNQLPGASQRVTPAHASLMPKILSHGWNEPALRTNAYAHHYRFIGIEFAPANATVIVSDLIKLGDGTSAQNSLAMIPHHLVIDRCYIHGFQSMELKRGIALNSAETTITNSHISDIHGYGYDTQAICGWNGPGPYHITNNYLEAAGENVMFGGADPSISGLIPSDIEIRRNHFFKPLSWKVGDPSYAGYRWTVKNLFETKNARRVIVDGNIFENCWPDAQVGFAILLKSNNQDATAPWSVTEDLTFSNNIVRNVEHGVNILAIEVPPKLSGVAKRIRIVNNFWDVRKIWYQGSNGAQGLVLDHNTFLTRDGSTAVLYGIVTQGFEFRNNLGVRAGYGFKGDATGEGTAALNQFCPGWIFEKNVLVAASGSSYPTGNYYPAALTDVGFVDLANSNYRLSSSSPYRNLGTDGKDIGVDFDALNAAVGTAPSLPTPTPTPNPSPTATPTPTPSATPTPTPTPTPVPSPTPSPSPTPAPIQISVNITTPANNSMFNYGADMNVNATASSASGTITRVEFYDGSNLIGTSTAAPYGIVWSNGPSGNHSLTAVARDNTGNFSTSSAVTVKISKSLSGVRNNKRNASTLTTSGGNSGGGTAPAAGPTDFEALASSLEQTYYDYADERSMFNSSNTIDRSLFAALLLARSTVGLARHSASTAVDDRLDKIEAYLSICEDLMVRDAVSNSTLVRASQVNASTGLTITQPIASPMGSGYMLSPTNSARLVLSSTTPFTTQTTTSSTGSFELAGVSVSVNGQAASLTSIAPNEITFIVPPALWGGLVDVVVTSREGYMSHGTAAVFGLYPAIFRVAGDPDRGAVLDAVSLQSTISAVSNGLFNLDGRSRMSIWASGISTGVANRDTSNDVLMANGRVLENVAEEISVEARLPDGQTFMLPVEYAGPQGSIVGLDQINVVLVPELRGVGNVQLTILIGLVRSNSLRVAIQ